MSEITAPRGEVTMPIRRGNSGNGRLALFIEEAFGRQFPLELLESKLQRAVTLRLKVFDV